MKLLLELQQISEAADEILPITVSVTGDKFTISTTAKKGPTLDVIFQVFNAFNRKRGFKVTMKAGGTADVSRMLRNRPNGFVVIAKDSVGDKEKFVLKMIEDSIKKGTEKIKRQLQADAKYKADAPARKAAASKLNSEQRKADLAAYAVKYGKGTWNRVTYRQEGGDDGYQYVVRVDGRAIMNGLTQHQARYEKERQVKAIAQKEKLGQFA